jgi:hypothetical protein
VTASERCPEARTEEFDESQLALVTRIIDHARLGVAKFDSCY